MGGSRDFRVDMKFIWLAGATAPDICWSLPHLASGQHTLAAHAAGATLIGRVQLPQFMLPDLTYKRIEGILHTLGTEGMDQRGL